MNIKNAFKKENLMPVAVLVSICIIVAALLGAVNMLTSPVIETASAEAIKESLSIVMPDGEFGSESDALREDAPDTVKQVFTEKAGKGTVVVLLTNKGYTGNDIGITVAIDTEGKIIKAVVTKNDESIVPSSMAPGGDYGDSFIGRMIFSLSTRGVILTAWWQAVPVIVSWDTPQKKLLSIPSISMHPSSETVTIAWIGSL